MPETFTGPHIVRFELCLRMFDCSKVPHPKCAIELESGLLPRLVAADFRNTL
jgi:hypothetical protein